MASHWWRITVAALMTFLALCRPSDSQPDSKYTFLQEATTAPAVSYYDYIIIGGGTAGCPLAATLSQNFKVLLLERGGTPYGNPNITNLQSFSATLKDVSPTSPSQMFVSEDGVINARARVLGGGSCLNAGFYTRASPNYVQETGWDGSLVNQSYEWVEKVVAFEPPMHQWQAAVRDGLLEVGVLPYNGFTYDHVNGTKVGGTIFDRNGHRHSAADLLEYANPDNLTAILHATVIKIHFRRKGRPRPEARGVTFRDNMGTMHRAYLNMGTENEIILTAGAIGSPQLLMLSGIGPRDHLQSLGIDVLVDQSMVGEGMSDNPMNLIFIPSPSPVEISLVQVVGITRFGSYIEAASASNYSFANTHESGFMMFSPQTGQLSGSPGAMGGAMGREEATSNGGFLIEKVMGPLSTGHLRLRNKNPDDNPSVTFNYFQNPVDLQRCVQGIKTIEDVISSKAFEKFRYPNISMEALINMTLRIAVNRRPQSPNASKSLEQFCRDTVMTIWHYHGGCQMNRVVDGEYRVIGVDSLRVVDGSTFYFSPGTNPQATVMMLGRYAGVKIRNQRIGVHGITQSWAT